MTWRLTESPYTPINLTGMTVEFRLKEGETTLLTLTSGEAATALGSQLTIVSAVAGTILLKITDEETDTFSVASDVVGVLKYVGGDGLEHLLFKKQFKIEAA